MSKKLYRSENRVIAGICGGLAEYLDIDPVIVRAIFVGLIFAGGSGFLIYLILLILVPKKDNVFHPYVEVNEDGEAKVTPEKESSKNEIFENIKEDAADFKEKISSCAKKSCNKGAVIGGVIFIFIGLFFLLRLFFPIFQCKYSIPTTLIFLGILFLIFSRKSKK